MSWLLIPLFLSVVFNVYLWTSLKVEVRTAVIDKDLQIINVSTDVLIKENELRLKDSEIDLLRDDNDRLKNRVDSLESSLVKIATKEL